MNEHVMGELLKRFNQMREDIAYLQRAPAIPSVINAWAPSFGGFSAAPAGGIYRYTLLDHLCTLFIRMPNAGTSNATTFTITAPFTSANNAGMVYYAPILVMDNGITQTTAGMAMLSANSSTINLYKDWNAAAWTASGNKLAQLTLLFETA